MEIVVDRRWKRDTYTIGNMYINGKFFSNTLEDKDRGLKDSMTLQDISNLKVYGQTAIPTGTYKVVFFLAKLRRIYIQYYKNFCGGYLPRLLNVKGFNGILIHRGVDQTNTAGCLLVG